ncbi:hypothetical protein P175DRAFT_0476293 [Aspergillus ochraceoroseus IBT 24754]|uniref:Phytanoyl-CoA dioxygenase n=1 Tax=Aspergillus ochraceoroseus IBT 24754 TaxID=1392256 RepID=A0A2T5LYJ1_9EURO|nr:uncharacterized protein P175DRAFT_0476293 [Aspergillus ochraceoroseus IBT 24754]PTU21333.1 hypothetical protein P175DRAFT_0476293 [Aspergillus ochraceoroseus IBT 24754]
MAPPLVTVDASEPLDKINDIIARDGGVIVSNFLSPELLTELMTAIEPFFLDRKIYNSKATHGELGPDFFPYGSQRVYALLAKIPDQIVKIIRLPVWQGVMAHFLNDEFASYTGETLVSQKSGYMLATSAALRLVPGAKPQPLHRDQLAYHTRPDPANPLFTPMLGCLIAGSKSTYKNGATAVIPGSHLWGSDRMPNVEECTYAEMEAGSALFTLGSTYHGAGGNQCETTDPNALRTLFAVFGHMLPSQRDYFRRNQDETASTPMDIVRTFSPDILRLAGYEKAVGGVGYVEDHQSPSEFLHRDDCGIGKFGAAQLSSGTTKWTVS